MREKSRKSAKEKHEGKGNPARGKLPADTEEILKRLGAIELAVESLDERLSRSEARFIPYPGRVKGPRKKPS